MATQLKPMLVAAPSGNGWGFTPIGGWGQDFSPSFGGCDPMFGNCGQSGGGFDWTPWGGPIMGPSDWGSANNIPGFSNPFITSTTTGSGPIGGWPSSGGFDLGDIIKDLPGLVIGSTPVGMAGSATGSMAQAAGSALLGAIPWGRIAAILLGLLLIGGGLYLIKPVQAINVVNGAKGLLAA